MRSKIYIITLIIILMSSITLCGKTYQQNIEEYEAMLEEKTTDVEYLEEIKIQLHTTAEMLRICDEINGNLDELLSEKWHECNDKQVVLNVEIANIKSKIEELQVRQSNKSFVGNFTIYHYCPNKCCGTGTGKTASGTTATAYRTIAVDPSVIPLGSIVEINGVTYVAEDTGGAIKGNKIDICVATHSEALQKGVLKNVAVYIITE